MLGEVTLQRGILGEEHQLHHGRWWRAMPAPPQRIDVVGQEHAVLQHAPEQVQALRPDQRHVVVGLPDLRARAGPFGVDGLLRHVVQLRQERDAVPLDHDPSQALLVLHGGLRVAAHVAVDQQVREEQRPLGLDVRKPLEFLLLVVQAALGLEHGLMAIAQEALQPVAACQLAHDLRSHPIDERGVVHGERRIADDRQQRGVGLLGVGLARQDRQERQVRLRDVVGSDVQHRFLRSARAEQVEAGQRFERRLGHADRTGVDLHAAAIAACRHAPRSRSRACGRRVRCSR